VPYLGEIRFFSWDQVPPGWALCDGTLLPIAGNQGLYALLGSEYGGDGKSNFGLPDLRGRTPVGMGPVPPGSWGGEEAHLLVDAEMPAHTHVAEASADPADASDPNDAVLANAPVWATPGNPTALGAGTVSGTGGGKPHGNMQPYLALSACIAVRGIFPQTG
jgi:microcystin-dependent protein